MYQNGTTLLQRTDSTSSLVTPTPIQQSTDGGVLNTSAQPATNAPSDSKIRYTGVESNAADNIQSVSERSSESLDKSSRNGNGVPFVTSATFL